MELYHLGKTAIEIQNKHKVNLVNLSYSTTNSNYKSQKNITQQLPDINTDIRKLLTACTALTSISTSGKEARDSGNCCTLKPYTRIFMVAFHFHRWHCSRNRFDHGWCAFQKRNIQSRYAENKFESPWLYACSYIGVYREVGTWSILSCRLSEMNITGMITPLKNDSYHL